MIGDDGYRELAEANVQCPYCWEQIALLIEPASENQQYIEDCYVCCRPIQVTVAIGAEGVTEVGAERAD